MQRHFELSEIAKGDKLARYLLLRVLLDLVLDPGLALDGASRLSLLTTLCSQLEHPFKIKRWLD
jgi:hypothetical protein